MSKKMEAKRNNQRPDEIRKLSSFSTGRPCHPLELLRLAGEHPHIIQQTFYQLLVSVRLTAHRLGALLNHNASRQLNFEFVFFLNPLRSLCRLASLAIGGKRKCPDQEVHNNPKRSSGRLCDLGGEKGQTKK